MNAPSTAFAKNWSFGRVYVADTGHREVKELASGCGATPCIHAVGGKFAEGPVGVAADRFGNVYVALNVGFGGAVKEMAHDCRSSSCVSTRVDLSANPEGIAVDGSGNIYVTLYHERGVFEIPPGCGSLRCGTLLGDFGGENTWVRPSGIAVDGSGNVYVANTGRSKVVEMPPNCRRLACVTTLGSVSFKCVGTDTAPTGVAVDGYGNVYVAYGGCRGGIGPRGGVGVVPRNCRTQSCATALGGGFHWPYGVAVDGAVVLVADTENNQLKAMHVDCFTASCVHTIGEGFADPLGVAWQ